MWQAGTNFIGTAAERAGLADAGPGVRFYESDTGLTYARNEAGNAWLGPTAVIGAGAGVATRIATWSGANALTSSATFYYDVATGTFTLNNSVAAGMTSFNVYNPNVAANSRAGFTFNSDVVQLSALVFSNASAGGPRCNLTVTGGYFLFGTGAGQGLYLRSNASYVLTLAASTYVGCGTTLPDRKFHTEESDAVVGATTYVERLTHITTGAAAAGFGVGVEHELEDAGGGNDIAGVFATFWTNAAAGNETADHIIALMNGGAAAAEVARAVSNGDFKIQNDYWAQGSLGLTGTLTLDDGANWRITLTFVGGILTGQTTAGTTAALAQWVAA